MNCYFDEYAADEANKYYNIKFLRKVLLNELFISVDDSYFANKLRNRKTYLTLKFRKLNELVKFAEKIEDLPNRLDMLAEFAKETEEVRKNLMGYQKSNLKMIWI